MWRGSNIRTPSGRNIVPLDGPAETAVEVDGMGSSRRSKSSQSSMSSIFSGKGDSKASPVESSIGVGMHDFLMEGSRWEDPLEGRFPLMLLFRGVC